MLMANTEVREIRELHDDSSSAVLLVVGVLALILLGWLLYGRYGAPATGGNTAPAQTGQNSAGFNVNGSVQTPAPSTQQ